MLCLFLEINNKYLMSIGHLLLCTDCTGEMKSVIVIAMVFTSVLTLGESTGFGKFGFFTRIKAEAIS